jgi:general secretion pathway protein C
LAAFDPFFRVNQQGAAPVVVTSLNLQLFGVSENRATGRGSAIIAGADGQQRSYVIGEEIAPGVTLTGVGFDNVTISRGGTAEQLFLDQSTPATSVGQPAPPPSAVLPPIVSTPPPPPPPPIPVVNANPAPPPRTTTTTSTQAQPQVEPQQEPR